MLGGAYEKNIFCFFIILILSLAITETSLCKKDDKEFLDKIIGTYEYIYKYNTKNFIENHYIILENHENQLKG